MENDYTFIDVVDFDFVTSDLCLEEKFVFQNKYDVKKVVYLFALKGSFQFLTIRSNKTTRSRVQRRMVWLLS